MEYYNFTNEGINRLYRICRLIDGGNTDKSLMGALLDGFDMGAVYNIYEPKQPLDTLLWNVFQKKLYDLHQIISILQILKQTQLHYKDN